MENNYMIFTMNLLKKHSDITLAISTFYFKHLLHKILEKKLMDKNSLILQMNL
jgi:hypothetical protein